MDFAKQKNISNTTLRKLSKDDPINLKTIRTICEVDHCPLYDVIELAQENECNIKLIRGNDYLLGTVEDIECVFADNIISNGITTSTSIDGFMCFDSIGLDLLADYYGGGCGVYDLIDIGCTHDDCKHLFYQTISTVLDKNCAFDDDILIIGKLLE